MGTLKLYWMGSARAESMGADIKPCAVGDLQQSPRAEKPARLFH